MGLWNKLAYPLNKQARCACWVPQLLAQPPWKDSGTSTHLQSFIAKCLSPEMLAEVRASLTPVSLPTGALPSLLPQDLSSRIPPASTSAPFCTWSQGLPKRVLINNHRHFLQTISGVLKLPVTSAEAKIADRCQPRQKKHKLWKHSQNGKGS